LKKRKSGFTLVELLVVIIIIALLSSIVAPKLFGKLDDAKVKTAYSQMQMFSTALDSFRLDVGHYPTTEDGLKTLWDKHSTIKGWNGPYLPKKVKGDPWKTQYMYASPGKDGNDYELYSFGADGKKGGSDDSADISIWD